MDKEEQEVTSTSSYVCDDNDDCDNDFSKEELLNTFDKLRVNFGKGGLKNKTHQIQLDSLSKELGVLKSKNELLPTSNKKFLLEKDLKETQLKSHNSALNENPILNKKISNSCDHDRGVQILIIK